MILSCDVNAANLYFLEKQGKILLYKKDNYLFRKYIGNGENRNGWLLPADIEFKPYIQELLNIDKSPNFILLTEEQRLPLCKCISEKFPDYKIQFSYDEGDSDYIYNIEKMALLQGKDFQKKRNHISRFIRTYEDNWKFELYNKTSIMTSNFIQIQTIYNQWLKKYDGIENDFLISEKKSIDTVTNKNTFDKLDILAGIIYTANQPAAFAIASFTTPECINVHFEKCLEEQAENGCLAVLNQEFAKAILKNYPDCKYMNREEDLNIPGLRKSKLSYKPEYMLIKYHGRMEKAYE